MRHQHHDQDVDGAAGRNLQQWLEDVDGLVLPAALQRRDPAPGLHDGACSSAVGVRPRDYAVISVGTLSTSILYWRKPRRGSVERQFDRLWVLLSLYQGRSVPRARAGRLIAPGARPDHAVRRARAPRRQGELYASARWHSGIHLVGNVANAILYADPGLGAAAAWSRLLLSWLLAVAALTHCGARHAGAETAKASAAAVAAPRRRRGRAGTPSPQPLGPPRGPTRLAVRPRELHRCKLCGHRQAAVALDGRRPGTVPEVKFCHQLDAATSGCLAWRYRDQRRGATTPSARGTCERRTWLLSTRMIWRARAASCPQSRPASSLPAYAFYERRRSGSDRAAQRVQRWRSRRRGVWPRERDPAGAF